MSATASFRRLFCLLLVAAIGVAGCSRDPEKVKTEHMASAEAYMAKGQFREATVEFRVAIQAAPRFGPAHLGLAEAYGKLGDVSNAVREYLRAADLMPDDVPAQLKAGEALLLVGQFDGAKERATKLLAKANNSVEAQILLGNAMAALKDIDGAITEVEGAIEKDPKRSLTYTNLGVLQLAKGDREQAEAAFKRALEIDPKSIDATLALANFQWSAGQLAEAEQTLVRAVTLDAKSMAAHRALAAFYLSTKRLAEAESHLKAVADESAAVGPKLVLADYYREMGKPAEARRILDVVAERPESYVDAKSRIASIQYGAGQTEEAHKTIDDVIKKHPKDATAQLLKAGFLGAERRYADALAHATIAATASPRAPGPYMMIGSLQVLLGQDAEAIASFQETLKRSPKNLVARLGLSRVYAARNNWVASLEHAEAAVELEPRSRDAHLLYARALTETRNFTAADAELKILSAKFPQEQAIQFALGRYYVLTKDITKARAALGTAASGETGDIPALTQLVALDLAARKPADARARIDQRLTASPNSPTLLVLSAQVAQAAGDPAAAEGALRKAIAADPSFLIAYQSLAQLFFRQNRIEEARKEFEAITVQDPKSIGAHTMVGVLFEHQGKRVEARRHYEQALATNPRAAVPANNLAWLMAETGGDLDAALQLAQTAKAELPNRPEINDTLGWIYYRKGLTTLAISSLKQSVTADPRDPTYQYHLGLAYAKNGEKDLARESLQRALTIKPDFDGSDDARTVLKSIAG